MEIILSNIPTFLLATYRKRQPVNSWLYLGKNYNVVERIQGIWGPQAQEIDYARELYRISDERRDGFVGWIDKISFTNGAKREWLFSAPAIKNPYSSDLFLNVVYFFVLKNFIDAGKKIDLVVVDSSALARSLREAFPADIRLSPYQGILALRQAMGLSLRSVGRYGKSAYGFFRKRLWMAVVLKNRAQKILKASPNNIFIRNYVTGIYSEKADDISERHFFPGLNEFLKENNYQPVYLPFTVNVPCYKKLFQNVLKSKKIIIFPEEFLKAKDYWAALFAPFKALSCKLKTLPFGQYNFDALIKEDYYSNITEYAYLYAGLLSSFGRRLKEAGCALTGFINWAENQAMEKGLLSGLKEHFPGFKLIAAQPFLVPPNHLSFSMTKQDKILNLTPEKVLVTGPIRKESAAKYVPGLNVEYSPPFRYNNIFEFKDSSNTSNNIVILFGYSLSNAVYTLRTLIKFLDQLKGFDQVFLKVHPMGYFDAQKLKASFGQPLPENFKFVEDDVEKLAGQVSLGICGATGASMELVAKGIPVVCIAERYWLTMNYLVYREDPDLWELCFSEEEIISAVKRLQRIRSERPQDLKIRIEFFQSAFFAPSRKELWDNLLPDVRVRAYQQT
ncbi:MAG: hypothetical protein A2Z88_06280 [Omnitrophica WOR_2 bacterium GWA2_47_8]|nr:MAG: hypothetical protein A2Z88_06280 [Omnitrophica WOR_2 bacterium GWA2_47_8]